jgi:hypothetical protein
MSKLKENTQSWYFDCGTGFGTLDRTENPIAKRGDRGVPRRGRFWYTLAVRLITENKVFFGNSRASYEGVRKPAFFFS